jgi:hypothetical protein
MVAPGPGLFGLGASRRFGTDPAAAEPSILAGLDGARGRRGQVTTTGVALYNGALVRRVWRETRCRDFLHGNSVATTRLLRR